MDTEKDRVSYLISMTKDLHMIYGKKKEEVTYRRRITVARRSLVQSEGIDLVLYFGDFLSAKDNRYKVIGFYGKGTFGQVYRCLDRFTQTCVALKVLKSVERYNERYFREARILDMLKKSPSSAKENIVELRNTFVQNNHLCMVFEPLQGSLYNVMQSTGNTGLGWEYVKIVMRQLFSGLNLLREEGLIHSDIKPENILLVEGMNCQIKIADFGSCCQTEEGYPAYIQTRYYRAPEILNSQRYSFPIDMWSSGCILFELITGKILFEGYDRNNQRELVNRYCTELDNSLRLDGSTEKLCWIKRNLEYSCPENTLEVFNFLLRILRTEPSDRMTPEEAMNSLLLN
eukprot:GHVP01015557.1.p1 GENE.GHVP01015557.1~~GHVP01015557.1.p1  ORF type:complete len:371 (+),score=63.16 GHVP01015557.1:83-1114(+)